MKIENQTTIIGLIIGFSLGLFTGWSTGVNENVIVEETLDTYGIVEDTMDYRSVDTFVVNYDWGKEEVYIYEYN